MSFLKTNGQPMATAFGIGTLTTLAISFTFGLAILAVYVVSNRYKKLDDSLIEVIPMLTVLMSVMMQIDSSVQAVTFFGIFGVLSIVRFRSALTDQKGLTFILFAVIVGILVGTRQFALSGLAFVSLSGMVLIVPHVLPARHFFLLQCSFSDNHAERKLLLEQFISDQGLRYKVVKAHARASIRHSGKTRVPVMQLEVEIRRPGTVDTVKLFTLFQNFADQQGFSIRIVEGG